MFRPMPPLLSTVPRLNLKASKSAKVSSYHLIRSSTLAKIVIFIGQGSDRLKAYRVGSTLQCFLYRYARPLVEARVCITHRNVGRRDAVLVRNTINVLGVPGDRLVRNITGSIRIPGGRGVLLICNTIGFFRIPGGRGILLKCNTISTIGIPRG
jgi:hypothetical protein